MKWLLSLLNHRSAPVRFVQVGAHDGSSKSPLSAWRREGGWTGLMIEPVPALFEKLRGKFGDMPGMILENVAIGKERGTATFYSMRPLVKPPIEQYDMLGSFRKDVILRHRALLPDIEDHVVELAVPCWPLMDLVRRHDLLGAQVLVIDTEGYDYEILRTIDFDAFKPTLVIFEHKHLDGAHATDAAALLYRHGYHTIRANDEDAIAIHAEFISPAECEIVARPLLEHDSLMQMFETADKFTVHQLPSGGRQVRRSA